MRSGSAWSERRVMWPPGRPRGAQQPLELHGGDHVGVSAIAQFACLPGIVEPVAGRQDHRANLQSLFVWRLLVVNGVGLAGQHALIAFGTETTGQAARRLGQRLLLAEAQLNLAKVAHSVGYGCLWCLDAWAGSTSPRATISAISSSVSSVVGRGTNSRGVSSGTPRR